ncbi:MAG: GT2 family glycosyltransferase, partial [Hyphomicrobiaceae bacterium]
ARDRGWLLAVAETTRVPHIEADSLGRWSAARAEHLFRGTFTFMRLWAPHPFLATAIRLTHHSLSAVRRQRWGWLVGAWRGVFARTPVNQTDRGVGADSGAGKSGRR